MGVVGGWGEAVRWGKWIHPWILGENPIGLMGLVG